VAAFFTTTRTARKHLGKGRLYLARLFFFSLFFSCQLCLRREQD